MLYALLGSWYPFQGLRVEPFESLQKPSNWPQLGLIADFFAIAHAHPQSSRNCLTCYS
jgi:hypothetical protein